MQDEGHWNDASLYREGIREQLRSEVMTRKEANRVAGEKMLEVFPPFDAEEEAKSEDQQAVVTELRAHEQGLLGATPAAAR